MKLFSKILIANRGEIACRVMRTARRLGIQTVAVYSDADAGALHVKQADQAVRIGPAPVAQSYLLIDRIIAAAKETGAEAIHPGYGFLSENPDFVDAVVAAGLVFIGPSADSIRAMGLKDAAKRLMEKAGVPVVPGYHGEAQEIVILASKAREIGYPVLIKARAGGGGKGMRKVDDPDDFADALASAKREAKSAFGDDHVLVEKFIRKPRHIEVQVFGDNHGGAVHLFERDCSAQRRHQKVIEEAPAPGMTDEMRQAMTDAAVTAARTISYSGAGTIEFIVDGSSGLHPDRFWFMEMNTRLQVEHPVTEMVTGIDLVEWQLRIAAGERLPVDQGQIALSGHAFEARIYAEDPARDFLPATGRLHHLRFADAGDRPDELRIETGVRQGDQISPFYDPMIAKIVTHGRNRKSALAAMTHALAQTEIAGTITNLAFLGALAMDPDFSSGDVDTGLIERHSADLCSAAEPSEAIVVLAALSRHIETGAAKAADAWDRLTGYGHFNPLFFSQRLNRGETEIAVSIAMSGNGEYLVQIDDQEHRVGVTSSNNRLRLSGDLVLEAAIAQTPGEIAVFHNGDTFTFGLSDPLQAAGDDAGHGDRLTAPMPGQVKIVRVSTGEAVVKGQPLLVLEAMKMEHTIKAPHDGVIARIVDENEQVSEGAVLVRFDEV